MTFIFKVGRVRSTPEDVEEMYYYQPCVKQAYERSDADTCGSWIVYDFLHNYLKCASPPNIKPVEHGGSEQELLSKRFMDANKIRLTVNEEAWFCYLEKHYCKFAFLLFYIVSMISLFF